MLACIVCAAGESSKGSEWMAGEQAEGLVEAKKALITISWHC